MNSLHGGALRDAVEYGHVAVVDRLLELTVFIIHTIRC